MVNKVTIVRSHDHPDHICLELDEETSRKALGEYFEVWHSLDLHISTTSGHGEQVLAALGLEADKVIDI
jgi:hypothetical protein